MSNFMSINSGSHVFSLQILLLLPCVWDGATCMCAHLPHLTQNEEQVFWGSTPFDDHCCRVWHHQARSWDELIDQLDKMSAPPHSVFAISLSCRQVSACSRRSIAKHRSRRRICSHKTWLPEFIDIKLLITCLQWIFLKQTHFRWKEEKTSFAYSPQIGEFEDV